MDAGKLDRRVTLQRQGAETDNGFGTVPGAWATLATVWAEMVPMSGSERIAAAENAALANVRFRIRKSVPVADLNAKDQLVFGGLTHDIANVRLDGRAYLIIDAVARGDS
jgi:SPP1 family predicted phage head-tail adaptor